MSDSDFFVAESSFGRVVENDGELYLTMNPESGLKVGDHVYWDITDESIRLVKVEFEDESDVEDTAPVLYEIEATEVIKKVYWVELDANSPIEDISLDNLKPVKILYHPIEIDNYLCITDKELEENFVKEYGYRCSVDMIKSLHVKKI